MLGDFRIEQIISGQNKKLEKQILVSSRHPRLGVYKNPKMIVDRKRIVTNPRDPQNKNIKQK